jgi:hypothetical protein
MGDQLVSKYIGGLQQKIQDSLNIFDPVNVSAAHQRALLLEKTAAKVSTSFFGRGTGVARLDQAGRLHLETPLN